MKYLVMQSWDGEVGTLEKASIESISKYAESIGADYKFVQDKFIDKRQANGSPIQKMVMLEEKYDEYDVLVMTDCDMFCRDINTAQNIFTEESGCGVHTHIQTGLAQGMQKRHPLLFNVENSYWGGSTYRLPRNIRKKLRMFLDMREAEMFMTRTNHCDEGLMFRLNTLANTKGLFFKDTRWQHPNCWEGIEKSTLIHIRNKNMKGERNPNKLENYQELLDKGILK